VNKYENFLNIQTRIFVVCILYVEIFENIEYSSFRWYFEFEGLIICIVRDYYIWFISGLLIMSDISLSELKMRLKRVRQEPTIDRFDFLTNNEYLVGRGLVWRQAWNLAFRALHVIWEGQDFITLINFGHNMKS